MVQLRASGAIPASAATPSAASADEAVDPVCGMTVLTGPAGLRLEHDGITYYFCCVGCRRAFENDPAAYTRAKR